MTIEKMPADNKRSYAIGGSMVRQVQFSLARFVTGDRDVATKSPTAHTAARNVAFKILSLINTSFCFKRITL